MNKKSGFTLVELSFSVVFISILALMVVFVSMNMTNIFQRGMTVKEINTVGSSIIDEFRSAISNSSAKNLKDICSINYQYGDTFEDGVSMISKTKTQQACEADETYSFIYNVRMGEVKIDKSKEETIEVPLSGAFCTGVYSYVWNSGYFFNDKYEVMNHAEPAKLKYKLGGGTVEPIEKTDQYALQISVTPRENLSVSDILAENFKLIRITDPSRQVCFSKINEVAGDKEIKYIETKEPKFGEHMKNTPNYDISGDEYSNIYGEAVDLLSTNIYSNLALYDVNVFRPAQSEKDRNIFFSGSFILASINGGPNIVANRNYCAPPDDFDNEDFNYCSINKFNFAIQANGE